MLSLYAASFLKERYEKDEEYFRVYETYTPNFNKPMLTSKFYSKYEGPSHEIADPELVKKIEKNKCAIPRERYIWPCTENQKYGWFIEPLIEVDINDSRFYHPRRTTDFIKHALQLKMEESTLPKEKFTGIPFKVQ